MTHLVVYGDFNCPFSRLASARLARLEEAGAMKADFRAVEHDPRIPPDGEPVTGATEEELRGELARIRALLAPGEPDPLRLPTRRRNTASVIAAYAAAPEEERPRLRERIFAAYWEEDRPVPTATVAGEPDGDGPDTATSLRWREEWLALPDQIVPTMVLPGGDVLPGVEALTHLGRMEG